MQNSTAIRECDVDTVRIISIKGISKVGNSFLSDLGRPGKSYILVLAVELAADAAVETDCDVRAKLVVLIVL